jgi:hypothetical protein
MSDDNEEGQGSENTGNNSSKPIEINPPEYHDLRESVDPSKIKGKVIIKDRK